MSSYMTIYKARGPSTEDFHKEKQCTLGEFVSMGRLKEGMCILLKEYDSSGAFVRSHKLWIGGATLYHGPTASDADIGWRGPWKDYLISEVVEND